MLRSEAIVEDGREPYEGSDVPLVAGLAPVPASLPAGDPAGGDGTDAATDPATTAAAGDKVQDLALNGAQISSLVEVIQNVRDGVIPPASAVALLAAAFPGLDPKTIAAIVGPIEVKEPEPEPEPEPPSKPGAPASEGGNADDDPKRSALLEQAAEVLQLLRSRLDASPRRAGPDPVDYDGLYGPGGAAPAGAAGPDAPAA
jgi:hypothetical protein